MKTTKALNALVLALATGGLFISTGAWAADPVRGAPKQAAITWRGAGHLTALGQRFGGTLRQVGDIVHPLFRNGDAVYLMSKPGVGKVHVPVLSGTVIGVKSGVATKRYTIRWQDRQVTSGVSAKSLRRNKAPSKDTRGMNNRFGLPGSAAVSLAIPSLDPASREQWDGAMNGHQGHRGSSAQPAVPSLHPTSKKQ